jgi:hypothetical protein
MSAPGARAKARKQTPWGHKGETSASIQCWLPDMNIHSSTRDTARVALTFLWFSSKADTDNIFVNV